MSAESDLVLIFWEDKPFTYARIEKIEPDHKKDWYHVTLLLLLVPTQIVTWILKDIYISGAEFQMEDHKVRLEPVISAVENSFSEKENSPLKTISSCKIIPFPAGS